jgi:hypothetical protein
MRDRTLGSLTGVALISLDRDLLPNTGTNSEHTRGLWAMNARVFYQSQLSSRRVTDCTSRARRRSYRPLVFAGMWSGRGRSARGTEDLHLGDAKNPECIQN